MIAILSVLAGRRPAWDHREQYEPRKQRGHPKHSTPARGDSVEISEAGYSLAHVEPGPPGAAGS